ncbi:type I methionyl aminopeptidase [Mycoplasma sp. P36-A1]|uniref:type I methionyl aminopeptidase n=1 Tax=Mycoplasma sp. P36-A1 TaxID=3252900 RepID=UPI003C2B0BBF
MITIKSKREIELMAHAGHIVALVHQKMNDIIKPGMTTRELDTIARNIILENDAKPSFLGYGGFPASVCASVNQVLVHGFPDDKPLVEGDIVTIDVGAEYKGYHGDSAWTYAVGEVSQEDRQLMDVTKESLFQALSIVKPGIHLSDISNTVQTYVESFGFSVPIEYTGHGIGTHLHEDPAIPNYGKAGRGPILKEGMALAIEPMVNAGKRNTKTLRDGWTVETVDHKKTAHYEHTIIVTADGYEILTKL